MTKLGPGLRKLTVREQQNPGHENKGTDPGFVGTKDFVQEAVPHGNNITKSANIQCAP